MLKALLAIEGGNAVSLCDVIEHGGQKWLVPQWTVTPNKGYSTPERIVLMDTLAHQQVTDGQADFLINYPIPRFVLLGPGPIAADSGYTVIFHPAIRVRDPRAMN